MTARPADTPVLETERLTLRRPAPDDLDVFARFVASERSRWVGGPGSRADAWDGLAMTLGHWEMRGHGYFFADLRGAGETIGRFGVVAPLSHDEPELVWTLFDATHEGRGLALEGARAALAHARETLGLGAPVSRIRVGNLRSRALAGRLGARCGKRVEETGRPATEVWRHEAAAA